MTDKERFRQSREIAADAAKRIVKRSVAAGLNDIDIMIKPDVSISSTY